jgi:hypothetical protein
MITFATAGGYAVTGVVRSYAETIAQGQDAPAERYKYSRYFAFGTNADFREAQRVQAG